MSNNIFIQPAGVLHGDLPFYDIFWRGGTQDVIAIGSFRPRLFAKHSMDFNEFYIEKIDEKEMQIDGKIIFDSHQHTLIVNFENIPVGTKEVLVKCRSNLSWMQTYKLRNPLNSCNSDYCISTIIKNESRYIATWVDYHFRIGFNKIFLYDNGSSDRDILVQKLQKWIDLQVVVLIDWPFAYREIESGISGQTTQQNHSIYMLNTSSKWLSLTDVDEFIVLPKKKKISNTLNFFESDEISCINMECLWFGCSSLTQIDENNYLNQLVMRKKQTEGPYKRQKCIVKPSKIIVFSVHMVVNAVGAVYYSDPWTEIRFNHYWTLSFDAARKCEHEIYDIERDTTASDVMNKPF